MRPHRSVPAAVAVAVTVSMLLAGCGRHAKKPETAHSATPKPSASAAPRASQPSPSAATPSAPRHTYTGAQTPTKWDGRHYDLGQIVAYTRSGSDYLVQFDRFEPAEGSAALFGTREPVDLVGVTSDAPYTNNSTALTVVLVRGGVSYLIGPGEGSPCAPPADDTQIAPTPPWHPGSLQTLLDRTVSGDWRTVLLSYDTAGKVTQIRQDVCRP